MGRIRSIKPEFFQNFKLYKAEKESGLPLRLSFSGLWTASDREGRFKWIPEELQLQCLPFDRDVDFSRVLDALLTRGYLVKYSEKNEFFGFIPSWKAHQYINNREAPSILPTPSESNILTRAPRVDDPSEKCTWGRGREGEGKGKEKEAEIFQIFENENSTADERLLLIEKKENESLTEKEFFNPIPEIEEKKKEKNSAKKEKQSEKLIPMAHALCRAVFTEFYLSHKNLTYSWSGKDAGTMPILIGKLISKIKEVEKPVTPENIKESFILLLDKIPSLKDQWIYNNLEIAIINSKFNVIIDQSINGNTSSTNQRHTTSSARQGVSTDYINDLLAILGG